MLASRGLAAQVNLTASQRGSGKVNHTNGLGCAFVLKTRISRVEDGLGLLLESLE